MDQVNLITLIVYFTALFLILYRIFYSILGLVTIRVDQEALTRQLTQYELEEGLEINFDFADKYKLEPLEELTISIHNKFPDQSLYINWDQCTLTDFKKHSHRVIRFNSKLLVDIFLAQVFSVIGSEQTLEAKITSEDVLKRNEKGDLEIVDPLFDQKTLKEASEKGNRFTLQLIFQIIEAGVNPRNRPIFILKCEFIIEQMPWQQALIWKPKKKPEKTV
jgi:hypothetical protein